MVRGFESDVAAARQTPSRVSVRRPAFVKDCADHRPLHRPAHLHPGNRRSGVQDHAIAHARQVLARNTDPGTQDTPFLILIF
jgi:hypothetical protein